MAESTRRRCISPVAKAVVDSFSFIADEHSPVGVGDNNHVDVALVVYWFSVPAAGRFPSSFSCTSILGDDPL